jgi:hypothetical protein
VAIKPRHVASVEPYLGSGAYGDTYGAPFDLPCVYEGVRQLVRGADGSEAVSEGRLFADPVDLPVGSRVTILGRQTWVITVSTLDGTRDAHIEVALA